MKKIIIEVNEIEVEALTSVLVGALTQYKTLSENNPEALRQISDVCGITKWKTPIRRGVKTN